MNETNPEDRAAMAAQLSAAERDAVSSSDVVWTAVQNKAYNLGLTRGREEAELMRCVSKEPGERPVTPGPSGPKPGDCVRVPMGDGVFDMPVS